MENKFTTENLNVGDKVIVCSCDGYNGNRKYVGTITKKTPTGLVDVAYRNTGTSVRFKSDGSEQAKRDPWSRSSVSLSFYTPEQEEEINLADKKRAVVSWLSKLSKFEWEKLEYDKLKTVVEIVRGLKNS